MIKDEYTMLPDEFEPLSDEFEHRKGYIKAVAEQQKLLEHKKKVHKKALMRMLVTGTMAATVVANAFAYENKPVQTQPLPSDENTVIAVTPVTPEIKGDHTETPPVQEQKPEIIIEYVNCTSCNQAGIICPGDPNFGWDRGNGEGYAGCGGTGTAPCPDINCNGGMYTDPNCHGSGIGIHGEPCEYCNGRGVYPHEEFCMGTGFIECMTADAHYTCPDCNGTGRIAIEKSV